MKTIFIDTETTGTDVSKHGLIQLAAIVPAEPEDQSVPYTFNLPVRTFPQDTIEDEALKVSGITREEIEHKHFPPVEAYQMFTHFLSSFIDKFDRSDKFQVIAYNAGFDMDFLRAFFLKNGDKYFGSFFYWKPIDVPGLICFYDEINGNPIPTGTAKLVDQLARFDLEIPENLHDALADVRATMALYEKIKGLIRNS